MIILLLYYLIVSATILPFIDYLRRKKRMGQVLNIDHKVSVVLAVAMGFIVLVVWLFTLDLPVLVALNKMVWWKWPIWVICMAVGFVGARLLVYDFMLSVFNRTNPFKNSFTSNSKTEQFENKWKIGFWWQRLAGIALCILSVLISNWIS